MAIDIIWPKITETEPVTGTGMKKHCEGHTLMKHCDDTDNDNNGISAQFSCTCKAHQHINSLCGYAVGHVGITDVCFYMTTEKTRTSWTGLPTMNENMRQLSS